MRKRDEPVRLTRIYTRGGDKGETSLGDGSRVSKLDPRVAAMGDVDELNSLVGWASGLDRIQYELFDLGADLRGTTACASPTRRSAGSSTRWTKRMRRCRP